MRGDCAVNLSGEECVDAGSTREDDKWKTDDGTDNKAQFHQLTKQCRPKVHQDVTRDLMVVESNVAKETHLADTHTHTNKLTHRQRHMHRHTERHVNVWDWET